MGITGREDVGMTGSEDVGIKGKGSWRGEHMERGDGDMGKEEVGTQRQGVGNTGREGMGTQGETNAYRYITYYAW